MRRWLIFACVGCVAAATGAPWLRAQRYGEHNHRNASAPAGQYHAPVADQFVSTPGQMVTMPGQMVTTPGQTISPTPGVIAPFVMSPQPGEIPGGPIYRERRKREMHPVRPGRRHHRRHAYRPVYGVATGYAAPYFLEDYGADRASPAESGAYRQTLPSAAGAQRLAAPHHVPSGNRSPYQPGAASTARATASASNVIRRREPQLTIVMKNGATRKVRNYALTPTALIDLDKAASGREVKIPLSKVNLAATEKAAARAGLSFVVPTR